MNFRSALLLCLSVVPAQAESAYKPERVYGMMQLVAPWDGPGASLYNPAFLSEVQRGYLSWGDVQPVSGKGDQELVQAGVALGAGFACGLAWNANGSAVDGSNAVYQEDAYVPIVAWAWDSIWGSDFHLGLGAAVPFSHYNAFNAVENTSPSYDIGAHFRFPELKHRLGRFHAGLAVQSLFGGAVKLPDDNPPTFDEYYDAKHLSFEFTLLWSGAGGRLDIFHDHKLQTGTGGGSEGPYYGSIFGGRADLFNEWGVEFHFNRYAGVKAERTWLGYWSFGGTASIPAGPVDLGLELNLTHDKFLSPKDEGRGYLIASGLHAGL